MDILGSAESSFDYHGFVLKKDSPQVAEPSEKQSEELCATILESGSPELGPSGTPEWETGVRL